MAKRDLKVKYAQTVLGLAWTFIQPLVAVITYTLFFAYIMNFETEYPYILFVLSGILLWGLFNYIFAQGSTSVLSNQDLIQKLYFPKLILPLSKILVGLTELCVISIFFILLLTYYKVVLTFKIIFIPLFILGVIIFSFGLSLLLSAATSKNRDLNHVIPFLINFGIWFTPVFYPVTVLPDQYNKLLYINPMASYIQLFRWSIFNEPIDSYILIGILVSILFLIIGFFFQAN